MCLVSLWEETRTQTRTGGRPREDMGRTRGGHGEDTGKMASYKPRSHLTRKEPCKAMALDFQPPGLSNTFLLGKPLSGALPGQLEPMDTPHCPRPVPRSLRMASKAFVTQP